MTEKEIREFKNILECIAKKQGIDDIFQKEEISGRDRTNLTKGLEDWLKRNK